MSTQTLDRAIGLLQLLGSAGKDGLRLVDLQQRSGLTKPTVHRILDSLRGHGFVEQVETTRRYTLGTEMSVLGWSAARELEGLRETCEEDMREIAARTGDTSFLTVRSGKDAVCIDRHSGSYPVKAFTVDVGTRRPLGVGAGGIALIAAMDESRAEGLLIAAEKALKEYPQIDSRLLRKAVAAARANGYAYSDGFVLKGVRGLAVPILDGEDNCVAAISIAAIADRIPEQRVEQLVRLLHLHARRIQQRLQVACHGGVTRGRRVRASGRIGNRQSPA